MKGLKEFLVLLSENEALRAEVEKVKDDTAKIVKIAKEHGYEFTEGEYNDLKMEAVSGGASDAVNNLLNQGASLLSGFLNDPEKRKQITSTLDGLLGQAGEAIKNLENKK